MKNIYLIFNLVISALFSADIHGQDLILYEFAHPADAKRAKFVQLLNTSKDSLNVSSYQLKTYFNGRTTLGGSSVFTFPLGTVLPPGGLYTVSVLKTVFLEVFNCSSDAASLAANSNGDDVYSVCDSSGRIVDVYGVIGEDGTGTPWDFGLSVVQRLNLSPNYGKFDVADFKIIRPGNAADASPCRDTLDPLPVTLLSFSGRSEPDGILLEWSTAQEIDNDFFAVEHSDDSIDYTELARVPAGDPRGQAYSHTYLNPTAGTHYFRLRQVDLDGTTDTSATVSVHVDGPEATGLAAQVVGDELIVSQASARANSVFASDGRLVARLGGYAGESRLSLHALPAGIYVLTDGETSVRFLRP